MKKLIWLLCLLPSVALANGPKYTYPEVPGLDDEMNNIYHDIKNPVINYGTASTMTITNFQGVTTNSNACAGCVGEYKESVHTGNTNVPGTSNAWGDITSIALTSGDWMVTASAAINQAGATISNFVDYGISPNSGNTSSGLSLGQNYLEILGPSGSDDVALVMPSYRVSINSNTTYYFKMLMTYSAGTPIVQGYRLSAWRIR